MKKVLIVFLVFAYLNCYMGCYKSTMVPVDAVENKLDTNKNDMALEVFTVDSLRYIFAKNSYRFINDTLVGKPPKNYKDQEKWAKIALSDIYQMNQEVEEIDAGATCGIILLSLLIIGVIVGSQMDMDPTGSDLDFGDN